METQKPTGIQISQSAVNEIKRLASRDGINPPVIRVMVVGGGCSGMSYKLGFETGEPKPNDKIFENDGVKILVDSKSFLYLNGTILDFSDGLNGTGFSFTNPNAKRTCGCGSSFSV
jgi:iron-sulfur cluster assembly protein